jgi:AAA family ATP:ADP antiporter
MKFLALLKSSDRDFKKNLIFFFFAYFLALFNYPLIRASTISLFFEAYGAKSAPAAWVWTILFLTIIIYLCNKMQKYKSVQFVFTVISIISSLIFIAGSLSYFEGNKHFAYFSFIWKEICVVLQIHLLLGYSNNYFNKEDFKILVGPVGAIGSLGGIFGGLLTTYLSSHGGTMLVLQVGVAFVLIPLFFFLNTKKLTNVTETKKSPLASLDTPDLKKYVLYICAMVALTQFIINIADFKFNLAFETAVPTSDLRTAYLGNIYAATNALTFIFQFFFLPFILLKISERNLHFFIPISYLVCLVALIFGSSIGLLPVAMLYIYFKAADYSFFSAGKEILYQPLVGTQKYGAKYLTDMLVYRSSKALIAVILIYLQTPSILDIIMVGFLFIWLSVVVKLFSLHRKLFHY